MYDRRVKGQTLTLAVSGKLWGQSLVMIDKETQSLWSHLLGEAKRGKLNGEVLTTIPSVMTGWKTWRTTHPGTTVVRMSRTSETYRNPTYQSSDRIVIGLADKTHSRAWYFGDLSVNTAVNDRLGATTVLLAYNEEQGTAVLYGRRVGDRDLDFDWSGDKLIDQQTRSEWDLLTGEATDGPLKGKRLPQYAGTISFEDAWKRFHPKTTFWRPAGAKRKSD